jgi:undecaprenyl-diphosphatase
MSSLSIAHSVILGLVEGITEFLPISSTGHLIITERLLDLPQTEALDAYTVIIQIGAIAAVLGLYRHRIVELFRGLIGQSAQGRRLLIAIIVAFLPAGVVGAGLSKKIDAHLLNPTTVAIAWIVGGIILLVLLPRLRPGKGSPLESLTLRQAGIVGGAQVLALIPGTSRSLVTIIAAVVVGLSIGAAVEFSFLLGLLTLTAATAFKLVKNGSSVFHDYGTATPLLGVVVAGLAAFVAVRTFVALLKTRSMGVFGWYRIAAGVVTIILLASHTISK